MGTPSSVKLANITLYKHLQKNLPKYLYKSPSLQVRLIDDIFGLFTGTVDELKSWVAFLNASHPTIKFTVEMSNTHIPFLNTYVYIKNNTLITKLYKKPTDNK